MCFTLCLQRQRTVGPPNTLGTKAGLSTGTHVPAQRDDQLMLPASMPQGGCRVTATAAAAATTSHVAPTLSCEG